MMRLRFGSLFIILAEHEFFSRVLRDSTPRFVGPLVRRSVGPWLVSQSVPFLLFQRFQAF